MLSPLCCHCAGSTMLRSFPTLCSMAGATQLGDTGAVPSCATLMGDNNAPSMGVLGCKRSPGRALAPSSLCSPTVSVPPEVAACPHRGLWPGSSCPSLPNLGWAVWKLRLRFPPVCHSGNFCPDKSPRSVSPSLAPSCCSICTSSIA